MENTENFVTQLEFERSQNQLRQDLNKKIIAVDDKVDDLKELVLPLVETSKQTAENTRKIAESMDRFTEAQRQTNGKFYDKFHEHDLAFAGITGQFSAVDIKLASKAEGKSNNTKIILGVLVLMGTVITAIFQAAPALFN